MTLEYQCYKILLDECGGKEYQEKFLDNQNIRTLIANIVQFENTIELTLIRKQRNKYCRINTSIQRISSKHKFYLKNTIKINAYKIALVNMFREIIINYVNMFENKQRVGCPNKIYFHTQSSTLIILPPSFNTTSINGRILRRVIEIIESDKTLEAQLNGDVIHNLHINKQNIAKDDPDIEVLKCFLV